MEQYIADYLESQNLTQACKTNFQQEIGKRSRNTMKLSKNSKREQKVNSESEIDTFNELPKETQQVIQTNLQSPQNLTLLSPNQQSTQLLLPKLGSDTQIQQNLSNQDYDFKLKKKNHSDLNIGENKMFVKRRKFSQQPEHIQNKIDLNQKRLNIKNQNQKSLQFLKQPNSNIFVQKNFPYLFEPAEKQTQIQQQQNLALIQQQQVQIEQLTTTVDSKNKPAQQINQNNYNNNIRYFESANALNVQKKESSLSSFNSNIQNQQNPYCAYKEASVNNSFQDRVVQKYQVQKTFNCQNEVIIHYNKNAADQQQQQLSQYYFEDFEQEIKLQIKYKNQLQIHHFKLQKGQYFSIGTSSFGNNINVDSNSKLFDEAKKQYKGDFNLCQIGRSAEGIWYITKQTDLKNIDLFYQYENQAKNSENQQNQSNGISQNIYQIQNSVTLFIGNNILSIRDVLENQTQPIQ